MVRNSTKSVPYQDLKGLCAGLKKVYAAATGQAGRGALDGFAQKWDSKYPMIYKSRDAHWNGLSGFFKYPGEVRKAVYTANAIEPLNFQLRKVTRNRLIFVNGDAVYKIMYLAIRSASGKRAMPIRHWGMALHQFAVMFGNGRVPF
jgi:transposase-like protein